MPRASMDRALWVVVGKVASLMVLAGGVSLMRAEPLAVAVVALGLAAYAVSMANLLRGEDGAAPVPAPGQTAAGRRRPPGRGYVTDGGEWARGGE